MNILLLEDLFESIKKSHKQLETEFKRIEKQIEEEKDKELMKEDATKLLLIMGYLHHIQHEKPFVFNYLQQTLKSLNKSHIKVREHLDAMLELIQRFEKVEKVEKVQCYP